MGGGLSVSDVGEFGLISAIRRWIGDGASSRVVLGPGDDAALLRPRAGRDLVVSTDSVVEGVHFRFSTQSARLVGRRALVASSYQKFARSSSSISTLAALAQAFISAPYSVLPSRA